MIRSIVVVVLVSILVLNCGDEPKSEAQSSVSEEQESIQISEKDIEAMDYTDYALSPEAEDVVSEWEKYQELAIQMNYLKKGDLSFFNSELELLIEFVEAFNNGLPESLKTNSIQSRIKLLETTVFKLNDDLTLDNIKRSDKLFSIEQTLRAFSNLNFQINKKLERDLFDKIQPE